MGMVVAMSMSVLVAVVPSGGVSMPVVILRVAVILRLIVSTAVAVIVGASGVVLRVVRHGRQLNGTGSSGERAAPAMLAVCERTRSR